jgi:hypothetical protein
MIEVGGTGGWIGAVSRWPYNIDSDPDPTQSKERLLVLVLSRDTVSRDTDTALHKLEIDHRVQKGQIISDTDTASQRPFLSA